MGPLPAETVGGSGGAEEAVAGVAEAGDDVGEVVEPLVDGRGDTTSATRSVASRRARPSGAERMHTHGEPAGVALGQDAAGVLQRAPGGEHRVEHQHVTALEVRRHRVHVRLGLEGLLVAGHADEPVAVSGMRWSTAPSMPRPARSTGTTSGGSPMRTPGWGPSVWSGRPVRCGPNGWPRRRGSATACRSSGGTSPGRCVRHAAG